MPALDIDGNSLHYAERHSGPTQRVVLLIHGAGGSHAIWPERLYRLPDAQVLALDLPGHGRSAPPGRRSIDAYAAVVEAFLLRLGVARPVLVGHSMGSAIALTVAHRGRMPVAGLVLLGASARMPVGDALLGGWSADPERAAALVVEQGFSVPMPAAQDAVRLGLLATGAMTTFGDFLACSRFDARPSLTAIDAPALVIGGELDRLTPLRFAQSLAAGLPNGRLATLEGVGHFSMLEQPDRVARLIAAFLRQL